MKSARAATVMALIVCLVGTLPQAAAKPPSVDMIETAVGAPIGLCVLLGDDACSLAVQVAEKTDLTVYVQLLSDADVDKARRETDDAGFCGTRIFIERGSFSRIHLADNIADIVVDVGESEKVPEAEILRVLRPNGTAYLGSRKLTKPVPEGLDDWTHPYHGPDNNPVSEDNLARAPYLTQFLAEPRYAPLPQVAVASGGRVFKAFGNVAFKKREEAYLNTLVAFNGYNGSILWKRPLAEGVPVHRNTFVATRDIVYVGDNESCKLINAATGRLVDEIVIPATVARGAAWKWMAIENGVLYALVGEMGQRDPTTRWDRKLHGWPWPGISQGYNQREHPWGFARTVAAIDTKSKEVLWTHVEDEPIDSRAMCMKNGRIFVFSFGKFLASLDATTGRDKWRKTPDSDCDRRGRHSLRRGRYRQL
jgi:hypothetical protein